MRKVIVRWLLKDVIDFRGGCTCHSTIVHQCDEGLLEQVTNLVTKTHAVQRECKLQTKMYRDLQADMNSFKANFYDWAKRQLMC